jgi:hypothetical protein
MAGQFGAEREIHSGNSLLTRQPPLLGSATPDPDLGAAGFDRGQVLPGLRHLPLLAN